MNHYENCMQCPKKCGVNRTQKQKGFCQETDDLKIAFAGLHFGEEPLVTVFGGSGTTVVNFVETKLKELGYTVLNVEFSD